MQVYIGEISPSKSRGVFVAMAELGLALGILLILVLGAIPNTHYYHLAIVMVGIVTLFVLLGIWIPETPRWLLLKSKNEKEATAVMKYLRGPRYPKLKQEIEEIKSSMSAKKPNFWTILKQLFCDKSTLVPFLLLMYLFIYQQTGGSGSLAAYVGPIFFDIGLPFLNLIAAFALGGVSLIGAIISILSIEFAGRKLLLGISSFGMLVGSLILSVQFYLTQPSLCNNSTILELSPDAAIDCNAIVYPDGYCWSYTIHI